MQNILSRRGDKVSGIMKVAIIGAGLGGLISAAILSEKGEKVDVYERLPFIGGRFTNIPYKGFQISTGALHMIPHGKRGPLGQTLKKLGCNVEIEDSKPDGLALWNGELKTLRRKDFPEGSKNKFMKWYLLYKLLRTDKDLGKFEEGLDEFTVKFLRSFLGWSLSISSPEIKFSKFLSIVQKVEKFGGPGIPIGGCKGVIDSLVELIESNGGQIHKRKQVESILPAKDSEKTVRGLNVKGDIKSYDLVFSNLGHQATAKMLLKGHGIKNTHKLSNFTKKDNKNKNQKVLSQYLNRASALEPSSGVKYSISLEEPFIENTGVLFTPQLESISGMNEVTNADPNLAPNGKHFLMAHQPVLSNNLKYEINLGLTDLKNILKKYKYEVIAIQSYSNGWPVNRVKAGKDIGYKTPYKNLYVVGDGAKGDSIEVDGIALGIKELMRDLF